MGANCCSAANEPNNLHQNAKKVTSLTSKVWNDNQFTSENLYLYSTEAVARGERLTDVQYRLILNLSDSDETGYSGAIRVTFGL